MLTLKNLKIKFSALKKLTLSVICVSACSFKAQSGSGCFEVRYFHHKGTKHTEFFFVCSVPLPAAGRSVVYFFTAK